MASRANEWGGTDRMWRAATVRTTCEDGTYSVFVFDHNMMLLWKANIDMAAPDSVRNALVASAHKFACDLR